MEFPVPSKKRGPIAVRFGLSKKQQRRVKGPQHREHGGAHGRVKYFSYCPVCPIPTLADPEQAMHATVSFKTKKATCRNGHTWLVGGTSILSSQSYVLNTHSE